MDPTASGGSTAKPLGSSLANGISLFKRQPFLSGIGIGLISPIVIGALSYAIYWSFWIRGNETIREVAFMGIPLLSPLIVGAVAFAGRRTRFGLGAAFSGAVVLFVAAFFGGFMGCTMELRSPLVVTVVDAQTGQSLTEGSSIFVKDDELRVSLDEAESFLTLAERPGIYTITITRPGFDNWMRRDIRVRQELLCGHVKTEYLRAELNRQS